MIREFAFGLGRRHYFEDSSNMVKWMDLHSDTYMSLYEYDDDVKDYYAKTTKTEDDIKDVKHEHEKQIRKKLTNYRKENKLSIRALAEIFGLNVSTIREWMLDGDRKLNRKNYKIILSNLKHLENDTT